MNFDAKFAEGLSYRDYLDRYANESQRQRWDAQHERITLTDVEKEILHGFVREMKVLVLSGTWCGDCVEQCPVFDRFAQETALIRNVFFDRDEHPDLANELSVCGGARVPVVVFLSEDGYECGRYGDRTLAKYRHMAVSLDGAACPTGLVPPDSELLQDVVQDWLGEFERVQLMLRTSKRLRTLHGD